MRVVLDVFDEKKDPHYWEKEERARDTLSLLVDSTRNDNRTTAGRETGSRAVAEPYGQRRRIGADEVCVVMCSGRCITTSGWLQKKYKKSSRHIQVMDGTMHHVKRPEIGRASGTGRSIGSEGLLRRPQSTIRYLCLPLRSLSRSLKYLAILP